MNGNKKDNDYEILFCFEVLITDQYYLSNNNINLTLTALLKIKKTLDTAFIRVKPIGYNCSKMLYPKPKNEEESSLSRRVEILMTES